MTHVDDEGMDDAALSGEALTGIKAQ